MIRHKNFRLTGWFQLLHEGAWERGDGQVNEDLVEDAIRDAVKPLGITFQGGPLVHEVNLPAGG